MSQQVAHQEEVLNAERTCYTQHVSLDEFMQILSQMHSGSWSNWLQRCRMLS